METQTGLPRLPASFTDCMRRHVPAKSSPCLAVGFSGGADSTALLHMLLVQNRSRKNPFPITAVHVHHGIRGEEADRDADFCRSFCEAHAVPYREYRVDVPALAKEKHLSVEEAAREARYSCFTDFLSSHKEITHLFTAHHADDQAETILFRLLRGTAANGLSGIPEARSYPVGGREVLLVRPLLGLRKADLLRYCSENGLSYVTDSTNAEDDCSRNLIRNRILPDMEKINPDFPSALLRLSAQTSVDEAYFRSETSRVLSGIGDFRDIPMDRVQYLHPAMLGRVLHALYAQAIRDIRSSDSARYPLSDAHIAAMQKLILRNDPAPGSVDLPAKLRFSVFSAGNTCGFSEVPAKEPFLPSDPQPLLPGIPLVWNYDCICFADDHTEGSAEILCSLKNIYKLFISTPINSDTILHGIFVRPRRSRAEDHYLCGGSEKTVKDAVSAHKVPPALRQTLPLFCDDGGILWVPFCGIRDSVNPRSARSAKPYTLYYFYHL